MNMVLVLRSESIELMQTRLDFHIQGDFGK